MIPIWGLLHISLLSTNHNPKLFRTRDNLETWKYRSVMLMRISPLEFLGRTPTGKTKPAFIVCEDDQGNEIEVVAKLSKSSERGVTGLAMEGFVACLAADLGLHVPRPYVIQLNDEWIEAARFADGSWAEDATQSARAAFGSKRLPDGFVTWVAGSALVGEAGSQAASILLLDAVAKNADRRPENPNCLRFGDKIRIIDHELCFPQFLIGVGDAWQLGALQPLANPGWHIFRDALRGRDIDWQSAIDAWGALTDERIESYVSAIPLEWEASIPAIQDAANRVRQARDNVGDCVAEVQRVLKC